MSGRLITDSIDLSKLYRTVEAFTAKVTEKTTALLETATKLLAASDQIRSSPNVEIETVRSNLSQKMTQITKLNNMNSALLDLQKQILFEQCVMLGTPKQGLDQAKRIIKIVVDLGTYQDAFNKMQA
ncbi:MAG: hypothetical protein JSS32_07640 [Verrucomicrobia bacterium]|nr:hypothetical protein [Verrucomicrobiota bacterium]